MKMCQKWIFIGIAMIVACIGCLGVTDGWAGSRELWEGVGQALDSMIEERDCFDENKLSGGGDGARCRTQSQERMSRFQEEIRRRQEAKEARQRQDEEAREHQRQLSELNRQRAESVVVPVQPRQGNAVPSLQPDQRQFDTRTDRYQHNPANEATRCITVRSGEKGFFSTHIYNNCAFPIEVTWCANSQQEPNRCNVRGHDSRDFISAGGKTDMAEAFRPISWEYGACMKGTMWKLPEMSRRKEFRCVDR